MTRPEIIKSWSTDMTREELGVFKDEKAWYEAVNRTVANYRDMEQMKHSSGMLQEVRYQYDDMANGGDGGDLGFGGSDGDSRGATCRGYNYPGYPDSFFLAVKTLMGWF